MLGALGYRIDRGLQGMGHWVSRDPRLGGHWMSRMRKCRGVAMLEDTLGLQDRCGDPAISVSGSAGWEGTGVRGTGSVGISLAQSSCSDCLSWWVLFSKSFVFPKEMGVFLNPTKSDSVT